MILDQPNSAEDSKKKKIKADKYTKVIKVTNIIKL